MCGFLVEKRGRARVPPGPKYVTSRNGLGEQHLPRLTQPIPSLLWFSKLWSHFCRSPRSQRRALSGYSFFGSNQQHHDADYPTTTGPTLCIRCLRIGGVWGLSTLGSTRSLAAIGWRLLQSLCPRDLEVSMWSQVAIN